MKVSDAVQMRCCQEPTQQCAGDECQGWIGSRPDSDEGQCIWICTCFTIMKAMTPKGGSPIITPK